MGYAHATPTAQGVFIWVVNTRIAEKAMHTRGKRQEGQEIQSVIEQEKKTIHVYI
ncbi:MAG: hypothetical protein F6K50_28040 [Moorea sp. SIO3I7]|uniref:hypothetical protein n=1 Tax=unclassified Moorena TaxID=2683338 RepID=UPI0013BECF26|nr:MULTISPECIES: hypothetical protein [unclassified Moorena]NEN99191.1 hypothetical protein [Moorena sp. SIO3I7]NEO06578.1 hypothetical protein [Moorena sp. SIO3I8]NEO22843.1 hypothetical protein [Moorena sp. SIO4A5]NEQ61500.1 hypothetical protein [Moorena sp. SIO4A1]